MYQNCTTVQFQLALQYELKVASDHIVNLINDFVNSNLKYSRCSMA